MSVDVKICGLSSIEAVDCAIEAGADYIGLNFYPPSPRSIELHAARHLADRARGKIRVVALVVDADDALIEQIASIVDPDLFQAHGSETPERIAGIGELSGKPVIKVIKVKEQADIATAVDYAGCAAMILFDAKAPETLKDPLPGGNGIAFDWSLLDNRGAATDFMLSGGLDVGNVAEAVAVTRAPCVDVSSGIETSPGNKDLDLIRKFVEAAKSAG